TVTIVVRPLASAAGTTITDTAAVSGTLDDTDAMNNTATTSTAIIAAPSPMADLAVTGAGAPASGDIGSDWTITLTVTNRGPAPASGVTLVNPLPAGVQFVSTSGGTFDPGRQVITVPLGALKPGSSATVTLVLRPTAAGTITDTATATGTESDPD